MRRLSIFSVSLAYFIALSCHLNRFTTISTRHGKIDDKRVGEKNLDIELQNMYVFTVKHHWPNDIIMPPLY